VDIVRGLYDEDGVRARESSATARVRTAVMVLRAAIAYEAVRSRGVATDRMLSVLTTDTEIDPEILAAMSEVHGTTTDAAVTAYRVAELEVGMRVAQDVVGVNGAILIGRGMQVTEMLVERLTNFQCKGQLVEPVLVGSSGGSS